MTLKNDNGPGRALVFLNSLNLGGTEKAACLWAGYLAGRIRNGTASSDLQYVSALSLEDGPRRADLERLGVPLQILGAKNPASAAAVAEAIADADVIHAHAPGFPHQGDILGAALRHLGRKIPVVQTNIFGKLQNPAENTWTDFRLFISWTSCVQAARRAGRKLNREFFRRQSVAVYPVEAASAAESGKWKVESGKLRETLGLQSEHVLFGRFSRPEPNKWTPLVLDAFLDALRESPKLRLLLREPPPLVAEQLCRHKLAAWPSTFGSRPTVPIILLPATSDPDELAISQMACDVILHTSSIGESFGYGLAEPMALGKPVLTNSVPWHDQAQIELVRHAQCGLAASTPAAMKKAILRLAGQETWRTGLGIAARDHILQVADPGTSTARVEMAMRCAIENQDNTFADEDLEKARKTAAYLDKHQWGHSIQESAFLRSQNFRWTFLKWQRAFRDRLAGKDSPKSPR